MTSKKPDFLLEQRYDFKKLQEMKGFLQIMDVLLKEQDPHFSTAFIENIDKNIEKLQTENKTLSDKIVEISGLLKVQNDCATTTNNELQINFNKLQQQIESSSSLSLKLPEKQKANSDTLSKLRMEYNDLRFTKKIN